MLARLLADSAEDTVVVSEIRLPALILKRFVKDNGGLTERGFYECLDQDHQLHDLGLKQEDFSDDYTGDASQTISNALRRISDHVAGGRGVHRLALFKCGVIAHHLKELGSLMPGAKVLGVVRDPRAVAASCMQQKRPYAPGRLMCRGDAWYIGSEWESWCREHQKDVSVNLRIHTVRYEDITVEPESVIQEVCDFLGVNAAFTGQQSSQYQVDAREASLHPRIHASPDSKRVEAWREELSQADIASVEWNSAAGMRSWNYPPVLGQPRSRFRHASLYSRAYLSHLRKTYSHYLWRLKERFGR